MCIRDRFASDLDPASRRQLERGARLTELLKQPQYTPYPIEEQVVSIWAGTNGKLDNIPVDDVLRFESEMLDYLRRNTDVLDRLRDSGKLEDDTLAAMEEGVDAFARTFRPSEGAQPVDDTTDAQLDAENVNQERIVRKRR